MASIPSVAPGFLMIKVGPWLTKLASLEACRLGVRTSGGAQNWPAGWVLADTV